MELITLHRGFAKVFKEAESLDETSKKHLTEKAIEMLDPNSFQKFLHNVNARLTVARTKMLVDILRPRAKFSFKYKEEHRLPDGHIERRVYVMNVPNIGEVALFSIYFNPVLNRNYIWFVQGVKGVDMRKVLKAAQITPPIEGKFLPVDPKKKRVSKLFKEMGLINKR